MAWTTLGDGERVRLQARGVLPRCDGLTLTYRDLPFYDAGGLLCAELAGHRFYMVAAGDGPVSARRLVPVRNAWEIHDANDMCGLRITGDTAGDYLRFFSEFIATPDGSHFAVVEELGAGWLPTGDAPEDGLALLSAPCDEGISYLIKTLSIVTTTSSRALALAASILTSGFSSTARPYQYFAA